MKFKIDNSRFFTALVATMVTSAVIHLVISFIAAVLTGKAEYANMFNVLGISILFPSLGTSNLAAIFGTLAVIIAGALAYFYLGYREKRLSQGGENSSADTK